MTQQKKRKYFEFRIFKIIWSTIRKIRFVYKNVSSEILGRSQIKVGCVIKILVLNEDRARVYQCDDFIVFNNTHILYN